MFRGAESFLTATCLVWALPSTVLAQETETKIDLSSGKAIFHAACAGCHGSDGKGAPDTTVGFDKPETFPDFTRCDQTTPELDVDWRAIIREGGRGRGFSRIMPSFSEALTPRQIDMVIGYLRSFCTDPKYPRGELNLPRPQVTEKAFPEDEVVVTTSMNAQGAPGVNQTIQYEHRLSRRNQMEVSLPVGFTHDTGRWLGGVGDIGVGLKRVVAATSRSILSVQGEVILPTGNQSKGLGSGVTTFEGFATFGQLLPFYSFVQSQVGMEQPTHTSTAPRAVYWRTAVGKSFRQGLGVGRLWSPMVEFIADRDVVKRAVTNWDVFPQFQVTLNRRQHIRVNFGTRIPVTNTIGRPIQVSMYLLWDWFDGGVLEGWK
jgi:Cytochrome C oxidase, cbb3-type, subunit III